MRKLLPIILIVVALGAGAYVGYNKGSRGKQPRPEGPVLVVSFLEPDLGGAVVLQTPEKGFIVVDPGPSATSEALAGHLREAGAKSLIVMVTNPTRDRAGAVSYLLEAFHVKRIIHGESNRSSIAWMQAIEKAREERVPEMLLSAGDMVSLSPSTRLEVLSPPKGLLPGLDSDSDNNSLVGRVRFGDKRLVLMSDAGTEAEAGMIRSGVDLEGEVFTVARYGRAGATSIELVSMVRPHYCVVMTGGPHHRLSKTVLNRIDTQHTGAELYRTDRDGTIGIVTDGRSIVVETGRGRRG